MRRPKWPHGTRRSAGVLSIAALMLVVVLSGCSEDTDNGGQDCYVPAANGDPGGITVKGSAPSEEQLTNANLIVAAGKEHPDPQISQDSWAWTVAIATAIQESTLINVDHGDDAGPDSRGLFQQRASWGPEAVRMDPKGAATLFYDALVEVEGWQDMPLSEAAQAVQISAFPDAYAQWEEEAKKIVAAAGGIVCKEGGVNVQKVIDAAKSQLGVPYSWGGGDENGPTKGICEAGPAADDCNVVGFDCSGLMVYAFAQAGVTVPRTTQEMWNQLQPAITEKSQLQPGDMIMLATDKNPDKVHHVGLYLGEDKIIEAPHSGGHVQVVENVWAEGTKWSNEFIGALRPAGGSGVDVGPGGFTNPVPGAYISSGYGPRGGGMHNGVDLAAPEGTPMYAAGAGTVIYAGTAGGFGHAIYIQHGNGDVTVYGHMYSTEMVKTGQQVKAGQQIATVGSDGNSTGPHLHLEVRVGGKDGERIDPVPWLAERGVQL